MDDHLLLLCLCGQDVRRYIERRRENACRTAPNDLTRRKAEVSEHLIEAMGSRFAQLRGEQQMTTTGIDQGSSAELNLALWNRAWYLRHVRKGVSLEPV